MNEIAGLPYIEARFDQRGIIQNPEAMRLPPGATDLFVTSLECNSAADARQFYQKFFENFVVVGEPPTQLLRRCAVLGVIWPSRKADEEVTALSDSVDGPGAAGLSSTYAESQKLVEKQLDGMKAMFTEPAQQKALNDAKALLADLANDPSAQDQFVTRIRSLVDPSANQGGNIAKRFFAEKGYWILQRLASDSYSQRGVAFAVQKFLQYATFLESRTRAERVGRKGVAKLVDRLALQLQSLHLIGYSFGGYVTAAAAAHSHTDKLASMSLLQTPISHLSFSRHAGGFFRGIIEQKRVKGPIVATYTTTDEVVDLVYPIAERISGESNSAFGDPSARFGALGRYGLRGMGSEEVINRSLLPVGNKYSFEGGKVINLDISKFVKDSAGVTSKEVAQAVRSAVVLGSSLTPGGATPPPRRVRKPKPVFLGFSVPRHAERDITFAARFAAYIDSARREVEEQFKTLSDQGDRIVSDIPPDSAPYWTVGAPITVRLTGDHVEVEPPQRSFEWNGRKNLLNFLVRITKETNEPRIQLRFQVFLDAIEVAFVPLNVDLTSGVESPSIKTQTRRSPESAFASYASKDAMLVAQKLSALIRYAPSLDVFQDALDLRPGEEFKPQIEQEISKREAFFLFWSRNARASEWVHWELETALTKRGKEAITLMPLEDPTITEPPPGFEDQQQRDRYLFAGYAFQKVQEIARTKTPG